jgi:hypothetical protein
MNRSKFLRTEMEKGSPADLRLTPINSENITFSSRAHFVKILFFRIEYVNFDILSHFICQFGHCLS